MWVLADPLLFLNFILVVCNNLHTAYVEILANFGIISETIHKKTQNNKKAPQAIKQSKFITMSCVLMHLITNNTVTYQRYEIVQA